MHIDITFGLAIKIFTNLFPVNKAFVFRLNVNFNLDFRHHKRLFTLHGYQKIAQSYFGNILDNKVMALQTPKPQLTNITTPVTQKRYRIKLP